MTTSTEPPQRRLLRIILLVVAWMIIAPIILLLTTFNTLFLWNTSLPWAVARGVVAVLFVGAIVASIIAFKPRPRTLVGIAIAIAAVLTWYQFLPPSNDRAWQPNVARVARAEIDGDRLTIENIRDFRYRTEDDFDEAWVTRSYDLAKLEKLEVFFCYWGPTDIAHTMMSFGFSDGEQLALSVEVRKEADETYSPIASFFKKFELIYIFGDERDLVALRSNYRNEDVYLFPSPLPPEKVRLLLLDILARTNSLADEPKFYGTIEDNCTTSLVGHLNKVRDEPIPFNMDLLLNGHIPEMSWRKGNLGDLDTPFETVKARSAISERALAYGDGPEYSRRIRDGLGSP